MSLLRANLESFETLRNKLLALMAPELAAKNIIFVDYPLHLNVGDLLIHKGTKTLFKELGCVVRASYCERNYGILLKQKLPKDWVIVLHGGGNFGDIYPIHQKLRLDIIQAFPDNKIVLMPQSVHFNDSANFAHEQTFYRAHPQLKMFVRDEVSFDFMRDAIGDDKVFMAPDMATMLIGQWFWNQKVSGTLLFRRRDCEAVGNATEQHSFDWEMLFSKFDMKLYWWIVRLAKLEARQGRLLGAAYFWDLFINRVLAKAASYYASYQVVDTDRLHGMIFGLLLGKDIVMRDNSYGKIKRYYQYWLA